VTHRWTATVWIDGDWSGRKGEDGGEGDASPGGFCFISRVLFESP